LWLAIDDGAVVALATGVDFDVDNNSTMSALGLSFSLSSCKKINEI
jgi:hypothetical protein